MDMSNDQSIKVLVNEAVRARGSSYSPYSGFSVGAAVLSADGRIFTGANIENVSFGLTVCAERVAIFNAIAAGCTSIKKIAIACQDSNDAFKSSLMPCGACRQVMSEFASEDFEVLVDGVGTYRLSELLPAPFRNL
jgi:cytidine deaminase